MQWLRREISPNIEDVVRRSVIASVTSGARDVVWEGVIDVAWDVIWHSVWFAVRQEIRSGDEIRSTADG